MKPSHRAFLPFLVLLALLLPGNLLPAQPLISCGERVEGEITSAGETDRYRFEGSSGEAVQIVGESLDPALQLEVRILDPSGGVVLEKLLALPRSGSVKLPTSGTYTLEVGDYLGERTGRYALSLQFTTGRCAEPLACGESRGGAVSQRAEQTAFLFEAGQGEAVRVLSGMASSLGRFPYVEIFGPGGNLVESSSGGDSGSVVLPSGGLYTLVVSRFFSFFEQPRLDAYTVSLQFTTGRCAAAGIDGAVFEREAGSFLQQDAFGFESPGAAWVHLDSEALDYEPWAPEISLFDQLGTEIGTAAGGTADFFIPSPTSVTAVVTARDAARRTYRVRVDLPADRASEVTERRYTSPVLGSAASYSARHNQFLLVYALDLSGFGEYEIYGRRLGGESLVPIGSEFRISRMGPELDPAYQAADPVVAYDPTGDRYLVIWSGEDAADGKFELHGRFLAGATGEPLGQDDFRITFTGPDGNALLGAFRPRVVHLDSTGQFFLVWYADSGQDGAYDVFAQRLGPDGSGIGLPVRLNPTAATGAASSARNPDLAPDPERGTVLVVWQGPGSGSAGARLDAVRLDAATVSPLTPGIFTVSAGSGENLSAGGDAPPAVAFSASRAEYLAVWTTASGTVLARRANALTGELLGHGAIPLGPVAGGGRPAVGHSGAGGFLAVWEQELDGGEMELVGQRVDAHRGLRSGDLAFRVSRVGPDRDERFRARFPVVLSPPDEAGFLVTWSGSARPSGGNFLAVRRLPALGVHDGSLNWILSARETPLGTSGLPFEGVVAAGDAAGVAAVGGFGALSRIGEEGTLLWSLAPEDFSSKPAGFPLAAADGRFLLPGIPESEGGTGVLNAVGGDGRGEWVREAAFGGWGPLAEGAEGAFFGAVGEGLTALDSRGDLLWQFPVDGFVLSSAPVVDPGGRLLFAANAADGTGRSRLYSLNLEGRPKWSLDLGWAVPDHYALALAADGTVYVGGSRLAAVSPGGTVEWTARLEDAEGGGTQCSPVVGLRGDVLCAAGNRVEAFSAAGERIWVFHGDREEEQFAPHLAVDVDGAAYAVSAESGPEGMVGRLYSLDSSGVLRWKSIFPGEGLSGSIPSFDSSGNLYLISDQGSLLSVRTGGAGPVEGGWSVAGGDRGHSGRRTSSELDRLYFAQFADGADALASELLLLNPNSDLDVDARIRIRDDAGRPMTVDLNGTVVNGEASVRVPAGGLRTLRTDSRGTLQAGAAVIESEDPLAGLILFGGSVGLAGVGASAEQTSRFLVPIQTALSEGLNTGVALMNLEAFDQELDLRLLDREGRVLATAALSGGERLAAGGHLARYVNGFDWNAPVDFSSFSGLLEVGAGGRLSATAIQTRPGQYATMPVTAFSDRQWGRLLSQTVQAQTAGEASSYALQFAQFADGQDLLFSEILLFNPDRSFAVDASLLLRDDGGQPITVDLNGEVVQGVLSVKIPPLGFRSFRTDGRGTLVTGSVSVESNRQLSGVILFGGVVGLAGVGASRSLTHGFLAPMETDRARQVDTGVAFVNLEDRETSLDLVLADGEGATVGRARLTGAEALPARGHRALFVGEIDWDGEVDFGRFTGSLRVTADGAIAATVIQTRPGQFATMPVVPGAPNEE